MTDLSPLNPAPPPVPPSDFPTAPPSDYIPPPTESEGPLGSLRSFVQGTIDPILGTARDTVSDLVKSAIPILSPPAIQAGQGPLGGRMLSGAVDMLNPLPGNTSDLLRDLAFLAVPGSGGARAALRVGAGTGGAVLGAELSDQSKLAAAGTAIPGLALGEGVRKLTGGIGRPDRQSAADVQRVTAAMNEASPDLKLPANVEGLYQKAHAPGGIKDISQQRYRATIDTVEQGLLDPDRVLLTLPDGQDATFREAMDYIMKGSSAGSRAATGGPLNATPPSARQKAMDVIMTRKAVVDALRESPHPQEQALAKIVQEESKQYFIDNTARRLLRAPGVLNKETGLWNMRKAQEAFHKLLEKDMIPPDVYADFQAAFYRGAQPPQMDVRMEPNILKRGLYGMGGAMVGSKAGHPIIGYHSGVETARRTTPMQYVGETVSEAPVARMIGTPLSLGTAQSLKELLSGLE